MTTLAELPIGQTATVKSIEGHDEIAIRLLEMGLTPGVEVKLIGSALLGDPVELEVRGYRLSLRKAEAKRVQTK
jgi:ferrous iron transport protein A